MTLVLELLAAVSVLELLLWLPGLWRWRLALSDVIILGLAAGSGWLMAIRPGLWTAGLLILSLYRIIGLLRVPAGRLQPDNLRRNGWRTSMTLVSLQLLVVLTAGLAQRWRVTPLTAVYGLAGAQFVGAVLIWLSTRQAIRRSRPPLIEKHLSDRDLPTVTVAIPARNETDDLEACLQSLLKSDYPKLEILVLDDCSQERRTPEIIRGFAHDGVRFIPGRVPPEPWLAKNYAYQQLVEASSGTLLLFCGVDVRFAPQTIRHLVEIMLGQKRQMISILPENTVPDATWRPERWFVQAIRYAWELALPRGWLRRPAVLSTCWLIERQSLVRAGSFGAVRHSSSPESYFARQLGDRYDFVASDDQLRLVCQKTLPEQRATAIRTRYPQLHRRPELVALVAVTELGLLAGPLLIGAIGLVSDSWLLVGLSVVSFGLQSWAFAAIINLAYRQTVWQGYPLLLVATLYDIGLLHSSMWRYEFGSVVWKDRNICLPATQLQAVPHLPKLG